MNSCYTHKIPINIYLQFGKNIFHNFKPNTGEYKITYCEYIGLPKDNEKYKQQWHTDLSKKYIDHYVFKGNSYQQRATIALNYDFMINPDKRIHAV